MAAAISLFLCSQIFAMAVVNGVERIGNSEWVWQENNGSYEWMPIEISDDVFDKIDGIASIYITLPDNPVVGDLLIPISDIPPSYKAGKVYRYNGTSWVEISYTDDTLANAAYGLADESKSIATNAKE